MKRSQILRLSQISAGLQYAPQIQMLVQQKQQADQDLATGIAAQAAAARAIAAAAQRARQPMKRTFDSQIHTDNTANANVTADLAKLGPGADSFRGAADREAALENNLTTRARTHALSGLSALATNAAKGRAYAVLNLLTQHNQNVTGLNQKIQELQGEQGAAAAKGYLSLLGQEESRSISRGNLNERIRHDKQIEQGGGGSGASYKARHGGFTKSQVSRATSKAMASIREAQTWLGRGTPPDVLRTGGKVPHNVPVTGPDGKPLTDSRGQPKMQALTITVPKIDTLYIRAANELRQDGHLSQGTIHELRVNAVHVPKSWLPATYKPGKGPAQGGRPYGERPT